MGAEEIMEETVSAHPIQIPASGTHSGAIETHRFAYGLEFTGALDPSSGQVGRMCRAFR